MKADKAYNTEAEVEKIDGVDWIVVRQHGYRVGVYRSVEEMAVDVDLGTLTIKGKQDQ